MCVFLSVGVCLSARMCVCLCDCIRVFIYVSVNLYSNFLVFRRADLGIAYSHIYTSIRYAERAVTQSLLITSA